MIFISHKHDPDHKYAARIARKLQSNGISCWLAPESVAEGLDHAVEIVNAINCCEIFLLILTEHTHLSEYIRLELDFARNHKKRIIPLKIGEFEVEDVYTYLLGNKQARPFRFTPKDFDKLIEDCKQGERVVNMELNKNPKMYFSLIKGDYSDNIAYLIEEMPKELPNTVFAMGIDCSSDLHRSSSKGILKNVIEFLQREYNVYIDELQQLIQEAKISQLHHPDGDRRMRFKDSVVIEVPVRSKKTGNPFRLTLLLIANSRQEKRGKNHADKIVGIDSREIILEVFKKCEQMGKRATHLMIGAMGSNALGFSYGVITAEILNCFAFVQRQNVDPEKIHYPLNLWYSVRYEDMERVDLSSDEVISYISSVIRFFKEN